MPIALYIVTMAVCHWIITGYIITSPIIIRIPIISTIRIISHLNYYRS